MKRIFCLLFFCALYLCACSTNISTPQAVPSVTGEAPVAPQDCAYQWADQDLPQLSNSFQQSIHALQAGAEARAYAFGENCVRSDGSIAGFSAMETDFNVTLHVDDLADESELGGWIVKTMQVVKKIPHEQIAGPQPGRVSITFQANGDQKIINFYINQYQDLPTDLSHLEIYRALQAPQ